MARTGVMMLWVVVVVIVPALVTAPAVGILNKDIEVEVVSVVDETAVVPRGKKRRGSHTLVKHDVKHLRPI